MSNDTTQIRYNDPAGGTPSDIGPQVNTSYWDAVSLTEAVKDQTFTQLASVKDMPKHYGKKIVKFHYMPLLDDRNINDQGIDASGATIVDGNLYGSAKDIGLVTGKLPFLSETGGVVNRVGNTRIQLEVELQKMGFYYEYTKESLDFDTDSELYAHISQENVSGAVEVSEDVLQIDLLNGAGLLRYGGVATQDSEIIGEGEDISVLTYADFQRMSIDLANNNTPKKTTVITGSRMVDTKVVASGYFMYCGSELMPTLTKMEDYFGNAAFVGVEHYAGAGNVKDVNMINGEVGKIGDFRIIQAQKMLYWAGAGAAETEANEGYRATDGAYDVYPLLTIGAESFTTIGFQTSKGGSSKFRIKHVKPESDAAYSASNDPYGETGFTSIKWYYATMILRSERIALAKTVAEI